MEKGGGEMQTQCVSSNRWASLSITLEPEKRSSKYAKVTKVRWVGSKPPRGHLPQVTPIPTRRLPSWFAGRWPETLSIWQNSTLNYVFPALHWDSSSPHCFAQWLWSEGQGCKPQVCVGLLPSPQLCFHNLPFAAAKAITEISPCQGILIFE